ncbi:Mitochondrial inner membrane protease subunit 1 [Turdus rufiventris]|nr:Mitochondrial inner membrane protease subunit 1 [Turdus rufiventris]
MGGRLGERRPNGSPRCWHVPSWGAVKGARQRAGRIKLLVSLRSVAEGALVGDKLAVPSRDNVKKSHLFQDITKLAHICHTKSSVSSRCSGPSMEPTIQNSDIVFSENLSRHFYCIRKGDIVIVKSPNDPKSNICKRVIGLEGDRVCTSNPSDFLKSHSYVPKGHVWLEGDNLRNSTDSRCYGPVPYGLIRGRICLKIWPLTDFGFLRASPNGHRFLDD